MAAPAGAVRPLVGAGRGQSPGDACPGRLPTPLRARTLRRMNERESLRALLVRRSVTLGSFTLASGAKSDYYVDARLTTMTAEGQALVGLVVLDAIERSGLAPTHVGGLTMGADPVAYAVAHRSFLEGRPIDAFSVRKERKEHGARREVEGGLPGDARCLMVEDSMTTGASTLRAIEVVEVHGAAVVGVLTLVNRSEGAEALYRERGLPLLWIFTGAELLDAARSAT